MTKTTTHSTTLIETKSKFAFMKWLFLFGILFGIQNSFAQTNTWDGSSSNSWNTAANWSQNHVPTSAEDVVIPNVGTDPRYNVASSTVKSITVNSGGNLAFERATTLALTVTGSVTVNSGGTFIIRTGGSSATSTLNIGGDFVNNGSVDFVDSGVINVNFNGAAAQAISGTGTTMDLNAVTLTTASTFAINRAIDVDSNWTNNGKTVSGTGSVTFGGTTAIGGTTSTAFPNLIVSGTVTQGINTSVLGDYSQTAGTYNQNAGATAFSLAVTGNFTLSGSSVFNMQAASTGAGASTTVGGATGTTISGTATLNMDSGGAAAANVSVFQTTNLIASSTNSATGIIDFGNESNTKNNQFRISGNLTKTGTTGRFYTSGTPVNGGFVFNGPGTTQLVSIVPSSNTEYYNVTINSGAVVQLTSALTLGTSNNPASSMTVNGTLDTQALSPAILGGTSGTFLLASGSTLQTANVNGVVFGTTGTISTSVGTRTFTTPNYIFDGAANQTANFGNTTMNNLTISNTGGSVILNAAPTINGTLAVTAGTLDSATFQIIGNITNNFTLASGTTFRTSGGTTVNFPTLFTPGHCVFNAASTVEYYGTTQVINATPTYGNLNLSAAGTKTVGGSLTIAGNLSIASGALVNVGSIATHTANSLTLAGLGTAAAKFGSTSTSATTPVFKNNTYFTSGTTGYVTVGTSSCVAPTITFSSTPSICQAALSYAIPYTATTGSPDLYTISGTGITSVTNGALSAPSSSITVGLSSPAAVGTISSSVFTVSSSVTGCASSNLSSSVTVTPTVGTPSTPSPAATTICQASANTAYTTSATNATSYTWSVTGAGNSISGTGTTGTVTWGAAFSGSATVSVVANGCNGPSSSASTTVTVTPSVGTPSFTAGATTVCQDAADETYTATATTTTGITYSVSPGTAGTIGSSTGIMNWSSTFSGTATITASAAGCNGPKTANRVVTVTPTVGTPSFSSGSTSVCQDTSNTYVATASNNTGITYSVSPVEAGTIGSSSGIMSWDADFSGTATITATATGCNGPKSANRNVTVTPTVGTPTFTAGSTTVCQNAATETYTASATDSTSITYSVSPGSAGTIGFFSGSMNWSSTFSGTATITASAAGCNGPVTGSRVVTVTPTVGTPGTPSPAATTICQASANTAYTTSATNATSYTWSVTGAGNSISGTGTTGTVTWGAGFSGSATVSVVANGCNGPSSSASTTVTVTPSVGVPNFTAGATALCQDAANITYTATAANTTGITYSVLPIGAGVIGSSNGIMNWDADFSGIATITASAAGCNGPLTINRVVTITQTVGTPNFTAGATTLCQDAADTTYTATATTTSGITYLVSPVEAGTINSSTGIMNWNAAFSGTATITASAAGCNGPKTADRIVTVNALPIVTASDVSGCSGSLIALSGSATPVGGSGNYSVANPYAGTSSTTYTYSYTDTNGCSATSAPANITITPQPLWYLDSDDDQYYTGTPIASCTSPGLGYTTATLLGDGDCDDNSAIFNPGATDICYNNIDENCNGISSDGCAPVVVNMTPSYNNSTLSSLATAVPAVAYDYPSASNLKYRFSITNLTTGVTAPDVIQTSRYVTIPGALHTYNSQYTIKVSAVINEEVVAFAGNTITVNSPGIQQISLNTSSCGVTLAALTTTIVANAGLNATGYTFRIRLNDANPTPTYAYSQSATRFVGANTFTGFPLQYATSYKISVQYTSTDPTTNAPVQSGYGAECTVNTPSIPLTNLASPTCGSQVATMNANISAASASYATAYQFRIRLFSDNGPTPTYYYTVPNASRFSSLTAFQGITFAYSTDYAISVQYSVLNGATPVWSGYGAECKVKTPFFPVTSLIPGQCGQATPTLLTQQLNISPYPGFPNYKVRLEEIDGEDVVNSEERVVTYPHFKLSDFTIAQSGKNYNVSVAIKLNGVFGDYDTACDLFTEAPGKTVTAVSFKATAYPNPFANNFTLDVKTASQSSVNLKVYDMVGRLIEQRDVRVSDMENITIGNQYPSGVYNVIVSQENSVQTLRVIKR
jgi:hypothetical protein